MDDVADEVEKDDCTPGDLLLGPLVTGILQLKI